MLDAEEVVELRALQARAYGRDGGLDARDAARLAELTAQRRATGGSAAGVSGVPASVAQPVAESAPVIVGAPASESAPTADATTETDAEAEESAPPHTAPSTAPGLLRSLRAHWAPLAVAAVVVLALGVGAGWMLTRPAHVVTPLTAEQEEWQTILLADGESDYDPGSLRPLGTAADGDVVIWAATKEEGEWTCLILGDGETTAPVCDQTESVTETGLYGTLTIAGVDALFRQVSVQLLLTTEGIPAFIANSYDYSPGDSGMTYASEYERQAAENLASLGFDQNSLWVVGYDGDRPLWVGTQTATGEYCLVYDGLQDGQPMACEEAGANFEETREIGFVHLDSETGGMTTFTYTLGGGPQYLTVTRQPPSEVSADE